MVKTVNIAIQTDIDSKSVVKAVIVMRHIPRFQGCSQVAGLLGDTSHITSEKKTRRINVDPTSLRRTDFDKTFIYHTIAVRMQRPFYGTSANSSEPESAVLSGSSPFAYRNALCKIWMK